MSYRKLLAESQRKTYADLDKYENSIGAMGGLYQKHYGGGCNSCGGCAHCGGMKKLRSKILSLVKQQGTGFISNLSPQAKGELSSILGMGLQKRARKHVYRPLIGKHCPPLSKLRKAELQILAKKLGIHKKLSKQMKVAELRAWLKKHCSEYGKGDIKRRVTKYKFKEPSMRSKKKVKKPQFKVPQYKPSMTSKVEELLSGFKQPKKFTLKLGQGLRRKLKKSCFY